MPAARRLAGMLGLVLLLVVGVLAAGLAPPHPPLSPWGRGVGGEGAADSRPERPRLAVLLVFDQMRGDYLSRWQHLFGPGGFRRLAAEGAWFGNCRYDYSDTVTAAGHASLATGSSPCRHGIIGNTWFDRTAREAVYCVGSIRHAPVPPRPAAADRKKTIGVSPERLLVPTLADALKEATGGAGRVVSLSFKDRSAVLPGGRQPDVCCWFDTATGRFETSTYYRDALPSWVAAFNRGPDIGCRLGLPWQHLLPDLDYRTWSGPDDVDGEGNGAGQGRTFPHPTGSFTALYNSPYGNEVLARLARRAVEAEGLGNRPAPDLLCVSFSSNDAIGHVWGPDSQEVLDVTLRSDRLVADLLSFLDRRVGRGRYVVAVTADHGVCPLPEVARAEGKDAGRHPADLLKRGAEDFLRQTFPDSTSGTGGSLSREPWVEYAGEGWVYLDQTTIARHGLRPAEVEAALAGWLKKQRGIQTAYTRTQLLAGIPAEDAVGQAVLRSFYPERSGDVMMVNRPYWILWKVGKDNTTGTTHGSPHPYDRHVPLLASGPGIRAGAYSEAIRPQAAAVLLARSLGIPPPAAADAVVPEQVFAPNRGRP
jgi:hypothetical protein